MGETSQTLRSRFNNHRNRLKQLCGLYLYHHFNSDSHTLDDISIMPIEEVVLEPGDSMTLPSKRLQREEFWYRELCTVYPCGCCGVQWWSGVHGMQVHCCLPCAPRVYSIRIDYCILVFTILPVL